MRTISLTDKLEFNSSSTFLSSNLCLDDVDNDGNNELVVGHWQSGPLTPNCGDCPEESYGHVHVFKGNHNQPWRKAEHLQMVSCLTVGDICNIRRNLIVVLCTDARCFFFDANDVHASTVETDCGVMVIKHQQTIPASSKQVLIDDIDGDNQMEMLVGFSNRFVMSYRWTGQLDGDSGRLVPLQKWELAGHIGNMSVHRSGSDEVDVMVSQPGGSYVSLVVESPNLSSPRGRVESKSASLIYHPLFISSARNGMTKTEVLGSVHRQRAKRASYSALCTIDGTLMLLDKRDIIWSLQVDHQLIGLNKLDITNDEAEEVIVCSWDGMTYIVNHHKEIVRFQADTPCQAFVAGYYAVKPGHNEPVLVYATFGSKLVVYHNIKLERIPGQSLLHRLPEKLKDKMINNGLDVSNEASIRSAISWLLYERPRWSHLQRHLDPCQSSSDDEVKAKACDESKEKELESETTQSKRSTKRSDSEEWEEAVSRSADEKETCTAPD